MVSAIDRAKRALVTLLKSLATVYGLVLSVTRDAPDKDVRTAYVREWDVGVCDWDFEPDPFLAVGF